MTVLLFLGISTTLQAQEAVSANSAVDEEIHNRTYYKPIDNKGFTDPAQVIAKGRELLDAMLSSYLLSPYKMKLPFTLHFVCKERDGFSLNNIMGVD